MRIVAVALAGAVLVGCTGQTTPPSAPVSPRPTTASSQPEPSGTPTPQQSSPTGRISQGGGRAGEVSPTGRLPGDSTLVRATFGASQQAKGRPVALQRQTNSGWQQVASAKTDGSRLSRVPGAGHGRHFSRHRTRGQNPRRGGTPTAKAADQWNRVLNSGFDGSSLPRPWDYRLTDIYDAGGVGARLPVRATSR